MNLYLEFVKRFLLATPLIASSAFFTAPSRAATFALSQGELKFTNFSQEFIGLEKVNDAHTFGSVNGGITQQINKANINFIATPPEISTSALSIAFGQDKDYLGLAQTEAKIVGNFDVDAGKSFSFDFAAALNLRTAIDEPPTENAHSMGDVSFFLLDTTNIDKPNLSEFLSNLSLDDTMILAKNTLDFFSLAANLNTSGKDDYLDKENSKNVTLTQLFQDDEFQGNEEFASAFIGGSLQRSFANKTNLTLLAVRRSQARVTAKEPAMNSVALLSLALIAIGKKLNVKQLITKK
ncbi:MAG: hypothetical protein KME60_06865 [Cyanomargarita calcarea GSE-NOS-MK-12-04C]|jgi:hypothetical protein|uniref:PEP-CTERM sorting domain-containing protein n=1 Tax=Cyanomargarita calcarea GSE-NOS-MK-12-04C TaxID=2839659 RepID=A0A951QJP6_9CYAN|nr:hypothetical protein [Cyanomargarita calcarea GSE-NOS-MK-12-04C]